MRVAPLPYAVLATALILGGRSASLAAPPWPADPAQAAEELEAEWTLLATPDVSVSIRGVLRFALEAAGQHWHPERVEAALRRARAMQDQDRESETFGNFKLRSDHERVFDRNAVEFVMEHAGLLGLSFAE